MHIRHSLNTIRYLRLQQIAARLRKHLPRPRVRLAVTPELRPALARLGALPARPASLLGPTTLHLLNRQGEISDRAAWNRSPFGKLWLYNAHYFDDLNATGSEERLAWHQTLIARWIAENPPAEGNGWEPYPLSLRIVNWIKHALRTGSPGPGQLQSLALQAATLSRRLEFDLGANHLFVNAKALVFAGCYFAGPQAGEWLETGLRILTRELDEQILADGGHFERSPMYHSLIFEDLLDLLHLGRLYPTQFLQDMSEQLQAKASHMYTWLERLCHPDAGIALFNDATFGVAPLPRELFEYARRLGVQPAGGGLSDSGYIRIVCGDTVLLFDAGPIGPDYQPGHAHSDTLSFEVSDRGQRVLVNSGISTYAQGRYRDWQRGTAAHNTIRVDDLEQSETWAAFRVARRARPINVETDHASYVSASHDGYRRLSDPVIHCRRVEVEDGGLVIVDHLLGAAAHKVELFFHLAPEASVDIQLDPALRRQAKLTTYHPGFHLAVPKRTVSGLWRGRLPVCFVTRIRLRTSHTAVKDRLANLHESAFHR